MCPVPSPPVPPGFLPSPSLPVAPSAYSGLSLSHLVTHILQDLVQVPPSPRGDTTTRPAFLVPLPRTINTSFSMVLLTFQHTRYFTYSFILSVSLWTKVSSVSACVLHTRTQSLERSPRIRGLNDDSTSQPLLHLCPGLERELSQATHWAARVVSVFPEPRAV